MKKRLAIAFLLMMPAVIIACAGAVKDGKPTGGNFTEADYYRVAYSEEAGKSASELTPAEMVNPLMGTDSVVTYSNGNTYPAVALPWGMNFWTPQTGVNALGWAYSYRDQKIRGFRQTHQPSPWIGDYGCFSIMPVTGMLKKGQFARASSYSHGTEVAKPYYYKVLLENYDTTVEIAPTERAAVMRVSFPSDKSSYLVIDVMGGGGKAEVDEAAGRVTGYTRANRGGVPDNFHNWFVIEPGVPIIDSGTWSRGAWVKLDTGGSGTAEVKTASSFISTEQALLNLSSEVGESGFDDVMAAAKEAWNDELGRIKVSGGTIEERATFYSCLYRVLLFPRKFYEHREDGTPYYYSPYDGKIHDGHMYTDNGFWDTFRAVFPFFTLMYPEFDERIMGSLVAAYEQGGRLPSWSSPGYRNCMIGAHSASLLADAYVKGIRGFDEEKAWKAMVKDAEVPEPRMPALGRDGVELYNEYGYVPSDAKVNENVAKTLEYAYDDFCMASFARAAGMDEDEYAVYAERAMNYKNLFDPETGFMRGKEKNGQFEEPFNPFSWGGNFTEGSAWHYTWSVFHDPAGLIELFGGREAFVTKLDAVFTTPPEAEYSYYGHKIHEIAEMEEGGMGQYAHGNQPIQHAIYLYDWAAQPWKAQARVREVLDRMYSPFPNGYCGDEDNGQTSAWFVFSALGFYPVCPGVPEYAVGSPLFERAEIELPNGNTLVILAEGNGPGKVYIKGAKMRGKKFTKNYLTHDELLEGGEIVFEMSDKPNKERGVAEEDRPYSMSEEW